MFERVEEDKGRMDRCRTSTSSPSRSTSGDDDGSDESAGGGVIPVEGAVAEAVVEDLFFEDEDEFGNEEISALSNQIDQLQSALDQIESRNDTIQKTLLEILHSNREVMKGLKEEAGASSSSSSPPAEPSLQGCSSSSSNVPDDKGVLRRIEGAMEQEAGDMSRDAMSLLSLMNAMKTEIDKL